MTSTAMARTLDGAMGTELLARGLVPGALPEGWLAGRAGDVAAVHASHVAAGAELLLTCTFNLASPRLGPDADVEELAARAVSLARSVASGASVAGAVGPSGLCGPGRPAPRAALLAALYSRAFAALSSEGVDLLWAESQYSAAEARAALRCALQTGRPAVVTVAFAAGGARAALPDGTPVRELLEELASMGAAAVGFNCVLPGTPGVEELVAGVAERVAVPVVAKPSAGLPGQVIAPGEFGRWCASLRSAGARWIGGCCGATPAHVAAAASAAHAR